MKERQIHDGYERSRGVVDGRDTQPQSGLKLITS